MSGYKMPQQAMSLLFAIKKDKKLVYIELETLFLKTEGFHAWYERMIKEAIADGRVGGSFELAKSPHLPKCVIHLRRSFVTFENGDKFKS